MRSSLPVRSNAAGFHAAVDRDTAKEAGVAILLNIGEANITPARDGSAGIKPATSCVVRRSNLPDGITWKVEYHQKSNEGA